MSTRRVLAVSRDLNQLRRLVTNLERAGAEASAARSVESLSASALGRGHVFLVEDRSELPAIHDLAQRLTGTAELVAIVPGADLADVSALMQHPRINHVITVAEDEAGLFVTAQKLLSGDLFGIEKILPHGTPVHYLRLRDREGARAATETVVQFAAVSGFRRQVRDAIARACEELILNALFEAPVDGRGERLFTHTDTHDPTRGGRGEAPQRSPKPVSIRYAATEAGFAIAIRDRYGRLDERTLLQSIERSLSSPGDPEATTGLYRVACNVATLTVNVAAGVATEVVCTFDRGAKAPLRSLDFFLHPDGAPEPGHG